MGKSPGKWIKTFLYGKKTSKSSTSRGRGEKFANERANLVPIKARESDLGLGQTIPSQTASKNLNRSEVEPVLERISYESHEDILTPGNQSIEGQESAAEKATYDLENSELKLAAAKVQAAFRGYLARRAFRGLKGILRLQALIRGHLVRRQAVATLYCMVGIIRLQAINRGRQIRQSSIGFEVQETCNLVNFKMKVMDPGVNLSVKMAKLSGNKFICKLLSSSPTGMLLHLHYEPENPNSVLIWLERWSASRFWKPASRPKKPRDPKSRRRLGNSPFGDAELGRPKHSVRRVPAAIIEVQTSSESEKPKRHFRKALNQPTYLVQENPEIELEKIKRNLRKVHSPVLETSALTQSKIEKQEQILEKGSGNSSHNILETLKQDPVKSSDSANHEPVDQNVSDLSKKINKDMSLVVSNFPDVGKAMEPIQKNSFPLSTNVEAAIEPKVSMASIKQDDDIPLTNGNHIGSTPKEEPKKKENQKTSRRVSNEMKQDSAENGTENGPKVPSYMAATESAKAKLRLQGSPRLNHDGLEKNSATRRHSLSTSVDSKMSFYSSWTQRPVQKAGRGNRSDKHSSKEGKARAEWRR